MNVFLIIFGVGLSVLGGYSIIRPQKIVDIGTRGSFEDSTLSDRGDLIQRGKGALVVFLGVMTIFAGLLI